MLSFEPRKMVDLKVSLEEPTTIEKPRLVEEPKSLDAKIAEEDIKCIVKSESVLEEKKPYPKMSLEWTNVKCGVLSDGTTKPYHILVKPNKILCGGISVIGNQQTFAGLHRTECWDDENPCCDWPDSHNKNNLIEYDKENEMLQVRLDSYVWDRKDDTLTFDWSLFESEAEDFCYERGLKKLHKIFDL